MCGSTVDIQSAMAEIRRGKKRRKKERRRNHRAKHIIVCPITYGDHNYNDRAVVTRTDSLIHKSITGIEFISIPPLLTELYSCWQWLHQVLAIICYPSCTTNIISIFGSHLTVVHFINTFPKFIVLHSHRCELGLYWVFTTLIPFLAFTQVGYIMTVF